jgi:hypothetical protein
MQGPPLTLGLVSWKLPRLFLGFVPDVYPAPFASGSGAGITVLGGEVALVSPVDSPAGTYAAKLTITITSQ